MTILPALRELRFYRYPSVLSISIGHFKGIRFQ